MNDLLYTLETQTADGLGACTAGEPWPVALIEARHKLIVQLCDQIKKGALVSEAQLARIRTVEKGGAAILDLIQKTGEALRESLRIASRQESFAKCVEAILDLPKPAETITA
jgi:hypothetical protein